MVNSAIEVSISFSFYIYMSFPPLPTGISGDKINVVIYMTLIFHWGILKYSATNLYEVALPEDTKSFANFQRIRLEELDKYAISKLVQTLIQVISNR